LTGFFGHRDFKNNKLLKRNQDLLRTGIEEGTYEYIIDTFTEIKELRNGFFHKHNLTEWDKVDTARDNAFLVFFLLLGAYLLTNSEEEKLGIIHTKVRDDYYSLCEYINIRVFSSKMLAKPIFYLDGHTEPYEFWMGYQDDFITYDDYGDPIYSGVYFRTLSDNPHIRKATLDNLTTEIWEGEMTISKSIPIQITPSGPQLLIYKDGKFCMNKQNLFNQRILS